MILKNVILALGILVHLISANDSGNVTIKIKNLNNHKGYLEVGVYCKSNGFPNKDEFAFKKLHFDLQNGKNEFQITNLPHGEYAISVYHDENSNGKLDTNFFGIPKEKTGVSNNPNVDFMPVFDDAKFQLKTSHETLEIELR